MVFSSEIDEVRVVIKVRKKKVLLIILFIGMELNRFGRVVKIRFMFVVGLMLVEKMIGKIMKLVIRVIIVLVLEIRFVDLLILVFLVR